MNNTFMDYNLESDRFRPTNLTTNVHINTLLTQFDEKKRLMAHTFSWLKGLNTYFYRHKELI